MTGLNTRAALMRTSAAAALLALGATAASAQETLIGGGSSTSEPAYANVLATIPLSINTTNCTAAGDFLYDVSSSGTGATAFVTNNAALYASSLTTACAAGALVSYGAADLPIASNYANGSTVFATATGYQMIQVPTFGLPTAIAFNLKGKTKNASVKLTDDDLCGIFSGKITDWSSSSLSNPPAKTSTPIKVAYRQDSASTSFQLSNHLASVCTTGPSGNSNITFTGMTTFAKEFAGYTCVGTPSLCTVPGGTFAADISAKGNSGVQASIFNNLNGTGYLGPDYTQISVTGMANPMSKPVATVEGKGESIFFLPNTTNTLAALAQAVIPPTSATNPDSFGILLPLVSNGYPIVGYSYLYLSSQYTSAAKIADVKDLLDALYNVDGTNSAAFTAITNAGFVGIPGVSSNKPVVTKGGKEKLAGFVVNDYLATKATVPFTVNVSGGR